MSKNACINIKQAKWSTVLNHEQLETNHRKSRPQIVDGLARLMFNRFNQSLSFYLSVCL